MRKFSLVLVAFLVGLSDSAATTFIERPFAESVQDAPAIVRGKTGGSQTNWATGADGNRRIYTFVDLSVDEVLKGGVPSGQNIVIRELGGEKDGFGMQISGTAHFERGEDVVLFLSDAPNSDGSYDLRGMMMAKLNVERGEDGREVLVGPVLGQGHRHGSGGTEVSHDAEAGVKWTLESLRRLVEKQRPLSPKPDPQPSVTVDLYKKQTVARAGPEPSVIPASPATEAATQASPLHTPTSGSSFLGWGGLALTAALALAFFLKKRR